MSGKEFRNLPLSLILSALKVGLQLHALNSTKNALFLNKFLNDHHLNDTQGVLYSYILQMILGRIFQSKKLKNTSSNCEVTLSSTIKSCIKFNEISRGKLQNFHLHIIYFASVNTALCPEVLL